MLSGESGGGAFHTAASDAASALAADLGAALPPRAATITVLAGGPSRAKSGRHDTRGGPIRQTEEEPAVGTNFESGRHKLSERGQFAKLQTQPRQFCGREKPLPPQTGGSGLGGSRWPMRPHSAPPIAHHARHPLEATRPVNAAAAAVRSLPRGARRAAALLRGVLLPRVGEGCPLVGRRQLVGMEERAPSKLGACSAAGARHRLPHAARNAPLLPASLLVPRHLASAAASGEQRKLRLWPSKPDEELATARAQRSTQSCHRREERPRGMRACSDHVPSGLRARRHAGKVRMVKDVDWHHAGDARTRTSPPLAVESVVLEPQIATVPDESAAAASDAATAAVAAAATAAIAAATFAAIAFASAAMRCRSRAAASRGGARWRRGQLQWRRWRRRRRRRRRQRRRRQRWR